MKKLEKKFLDPSVVQLSSVADMLRYCKKQAEDYGIVKDCTGFYNVLYYRAVGLFKEGGSFFVVIDFCEKEVSVTASV